ncbi:MAG: hypothetical protein FIA99_11510 [Ruminiclostridium sp.]|nr:hypothetical protein [Ruminiclostridium sp.]
MDNNSSNKMQSGGMLGGAYFLTIVGAAVYFLQNAASFWGGVLAILKAFVWPSFAIYKVLEILKL